LIECFFIPGLRESITEEDIKHYFEKFGPVARIKILGVRKGKKVKKKFIKGVGDGFEKRKIGQMI
jgi:RNA recognition motif-containing protein